MLLNAAFLLLLGSCYGRLHESELSSFARALGTSAPLRISSAMPMRRFSDHVDSRHVDLPLSTFGVRSMGSSPSQADMLFQGNDPENFKNTFGRGSSSGPVFTADHSRTQSNGRSLNHGRIVHNSIFQSNSNDFARDTTVKHNKNNFVAPKSLDFGFHPIAGPTFGLVQKPKTGNFDSGNLRSGSLSWNIGGSIVTAKLEPPTNLYRKDIKKHLLSEKDTGPNTKAAKKLIDSQGGKVLVTRSAKKLSDPLIASSSNRRESLLRSIRSRIIAGSLTKENFVSTDKDNSQFILTPNNNGQLNKFTSNHNHHDQNEQNSQLNQFTSNHKHHDQNEHNSQLNQFTSNQNHQNNQNEHNSQLNQFTSNQNHQNNQNEHNSQIFNSNNNRAKGPTVQRQIPISIISDVIPAPQHNTRFQPSHNFISNFNQNNFVRNENQGHHHRNNQFLHSENTNNGVRLNHNNKFEAQQNNQLTNQISQNNNQIETHHNDQNNGKVDHNKNRFVSLQNANHVIQNNNRFVSQQRNQHNHRLNHNSNNNFVAQHVQHQSNNNNNDFTRQNIVQHKKHTNQIKNKRIHTSNLSQKTPVPTRINVATPQPSPVTINQMVKSKNKLQKKPLSTTSSASIITARPQTATDKNGGEFRTVTSSFKTSKKPNSNLRMSKFHQKQKVVLSRKQIPKTAAFKTTQTSKTSSVSSSKQRTQRPQIINTSKSGQSKKSAQTINVSNSKTSARTINIHNSRKSKRPPQVTDVSGKPVAGGLPFSALQALGGSGGAGLSGAGLSGALAGLAGSGQHIVVKTIILDAADAENPDSDAFKKALAKATSEAKTELGVESSAELGVFGKRRRKRQLFAGDSYAETLGNAFSTGFGLYGSTIGLYLDSKLDSKTNFIRGMETISLLGVGQVQSLITGEEDDTGILG